MEVLSRLESLGYETCLKGNKIHLSWTNQGFPDPEIVLPLLEELKARKKEALEYLRGGVVFTERELSILKDVNLTTRDLKAIAEAKEVFGCQVVDILSEDT
jgi:hypothetical protein